MRFTKRWKPLNLLWKKQKQSKRISKNTATVVGCCGVFGCDFGFPKGEALRRMGCQGKVLRTANVPERLFTAGGLP